MLGSTSQDTRCSIHSGATAGLSGSLSAPPPTCARKRFSMRHHADHNCSTSFIDRDSAAGAIFSHSATAGEIGRRWCGRCSCHGLRSTDLGSCGISAIPGSDSSQAVQECQHLIVRTLERTEGEGKDRPPPQVRAIPASTRPRKLYCAVSLAMRPSTSRARVAARS